MTTAELTAALTALSPTTLAAIIAELEARLTATRPTKTACGPPQIKPDNRSKTMIIKMRLNQSERARLTALAQHYNLPAGHAGFGMALHNAIAEMTDQPARWGREDAPPAELDAPPDYLNLVVNDETYDALGKISRRAGTSGAPLKETLFFAVNTVLYQSAATRAARQRATTARILAQLETHTDGAHV